MFYLPSNTKFLPAVKDLPYFRYEITCNLFLTCESQELYQLSDNNSSHTTAHCISKEQTLTTLTLFLFWT